MRKVCFEYMSLYQTQADFDEHISKLAPTNCFISAMYEAKTILVFLLLTVFKLIVLDRHYDFLKIGYFARIKAALHWKLYLGVCCDLSLF